MASARRSPDALSVGLRLMRAAYLHSLSRVPEAHEVRVEANEDEVEETLFVPTPSMSRRLHLEAVALDASDARTMQLGALADVQAARLLALRLQGVKVSRRAALAVFHHA